MVVAVVVRISLVTVLGAKGSRPLYSRPLDPVASYTREFTPHTNVFYVDSVTCVALVAELRMLSSGESSAIVSNPAIVKRDRETLMRSLLEPGLLFSDAYPDSLVTAVQRLEFIDTDGDACHWKWLGYWLCCRLALLLKPPDIFSQTSALEMITHVSRAFLENLHGIRQW